MPDFKNIDYLRHGTAKQQAAYAALTALGVMQTLAQQNARLTGAIPIAVDIPGSDLDIICQTSAAEMAALAELLRREYGHLPRFSLAHKLRYGHAVLICDFHFGGFPVQVYASPTPVHAQRAWVHMLAEAHLLAQAGPEARAGVRALKLAGMKTEPAFAQVFGLAGDAYETLYALGIRVMQEMDDAEITKSAP